MFQTTFGEEKINEKLTAYEKMVSNLPEDLDYGQLYSTAGLAGYLYTYLRGPLTPDQIARIKSLKVSYREQVMRVPGHAKAISDTIRGRKVRDGGWNWMWMQHNPPELMPMLQYIQSPEAVGELGSFLDDRMGEKSGGLFEGQGDKHVYSMGIWAAAALSLMDIEDGPESVTEYDGRKLKMSDIAHIFHDAPDELVDPWKEWFDEVKAGKRTFQFRGDPLIYSLKGPVENKLVPLPKEKFGVSPQRRSKQDREPLLSIGGKTATSAQVQQGKRSSIPFLLAAFGLLVAIAIFIRYRITGKGVKTT
jgi:hypothetical protein